MNLKSVFIAYNEAYHSLILRLLDKQNLKGYTSWNHIEGRGSHGGEPHIGSHAWPTMNDALRELDERNPQEGLRAFVWNIEQTI